MGAGPGPLPSAFICAICGSFPAGLGARAAARARSKFNGSRFKVPHKRKAEKLKS